MRKKWRKSKDFLLLYLVLRHYAIIRTSSSPTNWAQESKNLIIVVSDKIHKDIIRKTCKTILLRLKINLIGWNVVNPYFNSIFRKKLGALGFQKFWGIRVPKELKNSVIFSEHFFDLYFNFWRIFRVFYQCVFCSQN